MFDWNKPTTQLLGRWQSWHDGQAQRAIDFGGQDAEIILYDFGCPMQATRDALNVDLMIWMHTNQATKYADSNAVFKCPWTCELEIASEDWWCEKNTSKVLDAVVRMLEVAQ